MTSKLGGLPNLGFGPVLAEAAPVPHNSNPGGVFSAIADAAETIKGIYEPEVEKIAAQKGAESVTRDAQGNLQAGPDRMAFTKADLAYENAAHAKYMAEAVLDIRPKIGALQQKYANDPEGFRSGLDGLVTGAIQNAPAQFQEPLSKLIMQEGGAAQSDLVNQKLNRDAVLAHQSVNTLIQANQNSLFAYARANNLNDPKAQVLMQQYQDAVRTKVANPILNYGDDQAAQDISEFQSQLKGQAVIGQAETLYTKLGAKGAELEVEKLMDDPALNLSPAERNTYAQQARQQIRILDSDTREKQNELQRELEYRLDDANSAALLTGDYTKVVSDDEIMKAYGANPAHATQIIGKLHASQEIYSMGKTVGMATPAELVAMEGKYNPSTNGAGKVPEGYNALWSQWIMPTEGGYSPADSNGAPVNFGINQKANPDIDVKGLTQAKAAQIAKDRYFVPSGADKLSGGLAAVQFDTAINMGVGAAKELLAKSNGDVRSYLDLREQKYRDIAASSPEKAKSLPAWLQRNENLRTFAMGGNVADQARIYSAFHEAVNRRNQALASDPAGYVLGNRRDVASMISSQNPQQVQGGVRQLLAIERDLGSPSSDILDKGQTQAIITQFNNPADPEHRAAGMNSVINSLSSRFGQYFPQVMTELTRKGMPNEAYALLLTRDDPGVSGRMANAIDNKKPLSDLMEGTGDKKDVDQGVTAALSDLARTTIAQGDGPQAISRLNSAARIYAYQLVQEGVPAAKAADRAVHDVITQHYAVHDTFRVPRGMDDSAVAEGASAFKAQIKDADLAPLGSITSAGATPETRAQMTAQIARKKAIWVTTPNEDGLQLVWPQELGYAPVKDAKGNLIRRTWGQLKSGAASGNAPRGADPWDAFYRALN